MASTGAIDFIILVLQCDKVLSIVIRARLQLYIIKLYRTQVLAL